MVLMETEGDFILAGCVGWKMLVSSSVDEVVPVTMKIAWHRIY